MTGTSAAPATESVDESSPTPGARDRGPYMPKLGEELPVFCERCGYSLHGLPQSRCDACTLLHFVCPECNHHQPINTLRPAAQRLIGRVQAAFTVATVFFKLNFFGWLLFAWFAMGVEWSYQYNYQGRGGNNVPQAITHIPRPIDYESMLAFAMFALPFGFVGRLLLLRWRRGVIVGAVLAALVVVLAGFGAYFRGYVDIGRAAAPLGFDIYILLVIAAASLVIGASIAWPVWTALVRAFVPTRSAVALLDWQRSLSDRRPDLQATRRLDAIAAANLA